MCESVHARVSVRALVCVSVRARVCERACALVCERACALVCARVSLCLNKGERNVGAVCLRACVYNQTNVRPVKYLEIQLNYITYYDITRPREKRTSTQSDICNG